MIKCIHPKTQYKFKFKMKDLKILYLNFFNLYKNILEKKIVNAILNYTLKIKLKMCYKKGF